MNFWKISTLILAVLLMLSFASNIFILLKVSGNLFAPFDNKHLAGQTGSVDYLAGQTGSAGSSLVKPVLAEEIYPLFFCPCCRQPLDKNKICCGGARERIDYIDSLVETKTSEEEVILAFVKKYGLNSFVDKNKAKEIKTELIKSAPVDRPIISLNPDSYDFGDVSQKKGKVFTYFDLKNEGKSDLVIDRLDTSCGCTFASIVFRGEEGPLFTMPGHGYENPEWEGVSIPAGETAQVKVMYDPDVHKDFRGAAIREISVFSNDPVDFEKKVRIELNQVD